MFRSQDIVDLVKVAQSGTKVAKSGTSSPRTSCKLGFTNSGPHNEHIPPQICLSRETFSQSLFLARSDCTNDM